MNKTVVILVIIILVIAGAVYFGGTDDDATPAPTSQEEQAFEVTVHNRSDSQPLSPGVYVVHTDDFSLDYSGDLSPDALEPLAEYGSNVEYADYVRSQAGVLEVITVDAPIVPGEETTLTFSVNPVEGTFFSGVQMLVATNDGYAVVNAAPLAEVSGSGMTIETPNFDNGTEENTEPGSGFEGGQPDPSRGEENIENGTPTEPQEPVAPHDQVTETVMEVVIVPTEA